MNVPINNQYMTPGFNEVIKRYMKKYNVSYREAASILGKRKKNTTEKKPKKLQQSEFNINIDEPPKYGDVDV
jgi:hypothetical protein|tara:strand:+ start:2983 stop:3198 length:216 start_codon:yes stop_codon:yes gene_type:complete